MEPKHVDYIKWRVFTPTLCLQIAVFAICIYYEILAVVAVFTGITKFSRNPRNGNLAREFPTIFLITQVEGYTWIALAVALFMTAVMGKVATRTVSRTLLAIVMGLQFVLTALLVTVAVILNQEGTIVEQLPELAFFNNATLVGQEVELLRTTELPRLVRVAGGLAASTTLGGGVTFALFLVIFHEKRGALKQFAYDDLVELKEDHVA
ncbi:hypothetical protein BV898_03182 [Hypsibius exemplaris]|uniref:Uncharacterized protein n=1 Tax=Hypsibius exemplaris TaxID=2072580 RepID=A0A1W0X5I4_HYPEX|nr:hypothetical protein BV898_03182 [Hypsibius exemplaris]